MRCLLVLCAALLAACAFADIDYTITPNPTAERLEFAVSFEANQPTVDVQLPRWAPGSYRLFNPGIREVKANRGGAELAVSAVDDNTWRIAAGSPGPITVTYSSPMRLNNGAVHMTGPHNYVYVVGRLAEPCNLRIRLPEGWRAINGLDESGNGWKAPDYDTLADNPITMGDYLLDTYSVKGKPHFIVLYGVGRDNIDRAALIDYCKDITLSQTAFFGDIPYNKYVWHFNVNNGLDGAGGLEHLSSTSIGLAAGLGPSAVSVLSHEFFHLWNVKRIRSKPLGPFDYQQLPKTGALWWLEGVTDYYASLLLHRYGILDQKYIYEDIVSNFRGYDNHPQRNNVSPNESSMRVGETNNGRGNSNGYLISYYTMGWISGLCLDIELRRLTNNKYTLDDVMLSLYQISGLPKPGFEEGEIRNQFVRFGGAEMGAYYDKIVHQNGGIAVREALAKIGLQIEQIDERYKDIGILFTGDDGAIQIRRDAGELKRGDRIKRIGSTYLGDLNAIQAAKAAQAAFDAAPAGVPIALDYAGDEEATVMITPQLRVRTVTRVTKVPGATTEQAMLREALLRVVPLPKE
jgi:predicted metalloprotease with PDZ domain